jgi:hypothetical protein
MRTKLNKWIITAAIMSSAGLAGCVQMPTEKQSVVDQRPQISFRYEDSGVRSARVLVDDLDVGRVSDFQDGRATLRVLPGSHVIKVQRGDESLLNERAYLADGAVRPFTIK